MKIAIIGSRDLYLNEINKFIPEDVTTIISGGARGIDTYARNYARKNGLKMIEFFPDYKKYGKSAPLERNILIIEEADVVFAFWDGKSRGTKFVIEECIKRKIPFKVFTEIKEYVYSNYQKFIIKGDKTMDNKKVNFTIRAEKELLKKFEYISDINGNSIDKEIEQKMVKMIEEFENEHGDIDTDEE